VTDQATVLLATIETARKLRVIPAEVGEALVVDASSLATADDVGPRLWHLEWEADKWHHWPSGTSGSLGEQLIGIASCYVERTPRVPTP
jgi:hypothetical protein